MGSKDYRRQDALAMILGQLTAYCNNGDVPDHVKNRVNETLEEQELQHLQIE